MNDDPDDLDELFDLDEPSGLDATALLEALVRQGRLTRQLLADRLVPALERIAVALERAPRIVARAGDDEPVPSRAQVNDLRARLEASRSANDPDAVITLRDELAEHLAAEALADLDREVVRWLIKLIQRRMRAGTVRSDVVQLAGRVADRFGATVEGASLRASLPTLRRSAGLCPVCGEPYTGLEDRCPRCHAAVPPPTPVPPDEAEEPGESASGPPAP
jgi:hypothetical protein